MSVTVSSLEPAIRAILTDPSTDLSSISAKRVRKQLVESADAGVTSDFVRANKDDIDALIAQIFEAVSADVGGVPEPPDDDDGYDAGALNGGSPLDAAQDEFDTPTPAPREKRKRNGYSDDENGDYAATDDGDDDDPPAKKLKSKDSSSKKSSSSKSRPALTDEELARQLSQELNSNPSRRSGSARVIGKRGASRTPKRIKKSRDIIDDDSDLSPNDDASPKPKKKRKSTTGKTGGGGRGGFQKELILSEPLAHLLQTDRMPRTQVVKKIWEYIRAHDLQNPSNRRQILCDPTMRAVFKQDKVDMFTMNKLLKDHLSQPEE